MLNKMATESNYISATDGIKLHYRHWEASQTDKVICIIHGHGEHSGRYEHVAAHLITNNISVFALDLRGHGLSKGKRGHAPSYELLLKDVEEILKVAREKFIDIPMYLMGHSLGGNLVANFLLKDISNELQGFILSSPWFKLAFDPPKIKLQLGKLMTKIWPAFSEHNGLDKTKLSKDEKEVKKYANDPLVHGMISAGLFSAINLACDYALNNGKKIKTKGLVYHGSDDQIIDVKSSETFANSNELIEWNLLNGVFHEPHNDLEKTAVLDMLCKWIKEN